eukprot:4628667-Prymnesium_polylepis.1
MRGAWCRRCVWRRERVGGGLWAVGYGLWAMGYGLWAVGGGSSTQRPGGRAAAYGSSTSSPSTEIERAVSTPSSACGEIAICRAV